MIASRFWHSNEGQLTEAGTVMCTLETFLSSSKAERMMSIARWLRWGMLSSTLMPIAKCSSLASN